MFWVRLVTLVQIRVDSTIYCNDMLRYNHTKRRKKRCVERACLVHQRKNKAGGQLGQIAANPRTAADLRRGLQHIKVARIRATYRMENSSRIQTFQKSLSQCIQQEKAAEAERMTDGILSIQTPPPGPRGGFGAAAVGGWWPLYMGAREAHQAPAGWPLQPGRPSHSGHWASVSLVGRGVRQTDSKPKRPIWAPSPRTCTGRALTDSSSSPGGPCFSPRVKTSGRTSPAHEAISGSADGSPILLRLRGRKGAPTGVRGGGG